MTKEIETNQVIQSSQNENTEREQPQEKQSVGEEAAAKDCSQPTGPIPYPQRLNKHKLVSTSLSLWRYLRNCTSIFHLLML